MAPDVLPNAPGYRCVGPIEQNLHPRRKASTLIRGLERVLVAFSGGVDSTLILRLAQQELGPNAVAVTAVSPSLARSDLAAAQALAREIGVVHELLESSETEDPRYRRNDPQRCYFCKTNVYQAIIDFAGEEGFSWILDGTNADDLGDHRPGLRAAREHGVRSPLQEAGIGKSETRAWARELGLSNWNRPANACLSSRVPYGSEVTPAKLAQIEQAEAALRELGFKELRVRHHDQVARIEVTRDQLPRAIEQGDLITEAMRKAGFSYATVDLAGFRSGSMNDVLRKR
ncbi:MAG: TIGR00268 family protein [Verrucomicrobiaceae bacterium]|nr:TIGR00268 family protein [Verrucomicrobiaceae bacterium]